MAAGVQISSILLLVLTQLFWGGKEASATSSEGYIVDSGLDLATQKLLNSFQRLVQDASSAQSMSDFTRELTGSVMQLLHHFPPSLVSNVVEVQTKAASTNEDLPNADDQPCSVDYTPMCPDNYVDAGDGINCKALQSYSGNCDKILDMSNKTPLEKRQIALNCDVQWRCQGTCPQEFSYSCPLGWIELEDSLCQSPDSYSGRCVRQKNFKDFDESMKEQWSTACGVHWPCRKINFDFSEKLCPVDWNEDGEKKCIAPGYYIGPCDLTIPVGKMSTEEKTKLAFLCNLKWPKKAKLEYDFSSPCPSGWTQLPTKYSDCQAPRNYQGPCNHIQSFENFGINNKYEWAQKCGATWPFKETVERNYEGPGAACPMGWKLLNRETGMCQAPASYEGRCSSPFSFKDYSAIMKSSWAHICEAQFEPKALSILEKLKAIPPHLAKSLGPELVNEGVVGPPGSSLWGKILAPNGTVYFPSTTTKTSDLPPIKPSSAASEIVTTQKHIDELKKIEKYEKQPQITSAIEDAISQLRTKGGNEKIDFSFMQTRNMQAYYDEDYVPPLPYASQMNQLYMLQQESMTGGAIENPEQECVRNYNNCPKGWQNLDDIRCLAPETYIQNGGTCNTVVELGRMANKYGQRDVQQIKLWAKECDAEFPCVTFPHDYVRSLCPLGWHDIGDGHCMAPADYPDNLKERCGTIVNFMFATPEYRQSWAKLCGADWPLFGQCETDFSEPCPIGFEKAMSPKGLLDKTNKCKAHGWRSDFDEEICRSPLVVPDNPASKRDIAVKCGVLWGCVGQCKMDYWQMCPYGWIYRAPYCYAPQDYAPPPGCSAQFRASTSIFGSSRHNLNRRAVQCESPWPCEGSCQYDWRQSCPKSWKPDRTKMLQGKIICQPHDYDGPCGGNPQDLTGYTFAQKQEFAFRCGVKWKCGGTKRILGMTLRTNKGWQKEEAYKDDNWESLKSVESMIPPPISPEEQMDLQQGEM